MKSNCLGAAILFLALPLTAVAAAPVDIEVLDRKTGGILPVYWHDGDRHIAGEPGREYEIRLRNRGECRVLAVTSVDGINVITGRTASTAQSGYVLDPRGLVEIDGWRKSMDEVATFYFTRLSNSYAARTGRPDNVGVIGVAVFRERQRRPHFLEDRAASAPAQPEAHEEARASEKLGTGHGHRETSPVEYVEFQRASSTPDERIIIYYDSTKNLLARGVIPEPGKYADRRPNPFPHEFVPDP